MQNPFWKEKGIRRENLINILKLVLNNSSKIGVKKIILPLVDNGSINNNNQYNVLVSTLKKIIPLLKFKLNNLARFAFVIITNTPVKEKITPKI